jgi:hypothetical protein
MLYLQRLALDSLGPEAIDRFGLNLRHRDLMHDQVVCSFLWHLSFAYVPTHGDIEQDVPLLYRSQPVRQRCPHHRSTFHDPDQPLCRRIPIKVKPERLASHPLHARLDGSMLASVLSRIETPMETRMILSRSIPRLGDIYLAFTWPGKRLRGKQPERRPDARRIGQCEGGGEVASKMGQAGTADEPGAGRGCAVPRLDGSEDQLAINGAAQR